MTEDQLERSKLIERLQKARSSYDTSARMGAAEALSAVFQYLEDTGIDWPLLVPLNEIMAALVDAERGLSNPLTEPAEYSGGSKKRWCEGSVMSAAAAAVTIQLEAGKTLDTALRDVTRTLPPNVSPKSLKDYRKNVLSGRAAFEFTFFYHRTVSAMRTTGDGKLSAQGKANKVLEQLREWSGRV